MKKNSQRLRKSFIDKMKSSLNITDNMLNMCVNLCSIKGISNEIKFFEFQLNDLNPIGWNIIEILQKSTFTQVSLISLWICCYIVLECFSVANRYFSVSKRDE